MNIINDHQKEDSYKSLWMNVASAIFITTLILIPIKVILCNDFSCFLKGEKLTDIFMLLITLCAFGLTYKKYLEYLKREKADVLSFYNERYSKDEHIRKVVKYIIAVMDNKCLKKTPSVYNTEMFMRFFEEMEIQIENSRLDVTQVYNLFSYYALIFDTNQQIRLNLSIKDYDTDQWQLFREFVSRMIKSRLRNTHWKSTGQNGGCIKFNEFDIISVDNKVYNYFYESGLISLENESEKIKLIIKGDNSPDELQYKEIIYMEEKHHDE